MDRPVANPRDFEPYFSSWMERLTYQGLFEKADIALELAKLSQAIGLIAPWLSASLSGGPVCKTYRDACEAVMKVDFPTQCEVVTGSIRRCEKGIMGCEVRHIPNDI